MNCLRQWRRWIRPFCVVIYALLLCVALPLMIKEFHSNQVSQPKQAWFIGGLFVIMSIPISIWGILQHLINYTQPHLQRHIIRILWMVPIYALNAWFALRFKEAAIYLDAMRECYEAYVIYNFMSYLLNYLRSEHPDLEGEMAARPQVNFLCPLCCCPPWTMGRNLINNCKHGVLQYTVIRPITTVIALICGITGVYTEGKFTKDSSWMYLMFVNNASQVWAMYCLIYFYKATRHELAPIKPVAKFLCVKAVVFLSFWQALLFAVLVSFGAISDKTWEFYTAENVATGLQDFCICIEMFLAAVAHNFAFSHKPFIDYAAYQDGCCESFLTMWDVSDVGRDVIEHVRHVGKTMRRPFEGRREVPATDETAPLLHGESAPPEVFSSHRHRDELAAVIEYSTDDGHLGDSSTPSGERQERKWSRDASEPLLSRTPPIDWKHSANHHPMLSHVTKRGIDEEEGVEEEKDRV